MCYPIFEERLHDIIAQLYDMPATSTTIQWRQDLHSQNFSFWVEAISNG